MTERLAIGLLTCERYDATAETLATLARHNDLGAFDLLHGDDGSLDDRIAPLALSYGFRPIARPAGGRLGMREMRRRIFKAAADRGIPWVYFLENDIRTLAPFPWALLAFVAADPTIYTLRLYGRFKGPGASDPCLTRHRHSGRPAGWRPLEGAPGGAEVGLIHWSALPAVTRTAIGLELHTGAGGEDASEARRTARVGENVAEHMGLARTAGRIR